MAEVAHRTERRGRQNGKQTRDGTKPRCTTVRRVHDSPPVSVGANVLTYLLLCPRPPTLPKRPSSALRRRVGGLPKPPGTCLACSLRRY
ncbi:hypothetical protein CGRA01v4_05424 [Colletotrichum graminicola]|nr:hypothetical protein CGRA01v4_05424 [Colletotrichum graminicola]